MKRCVIIGGAVIKNYQKIKNLLGADDFNIFCDSGLKHREKLELKPDLIIGDFDSYENPNEETETIVLPREKDDTDTVFAVKEAINRGFEDFLIIGAIGERLDHTLGNVYILSMLDALNKTAKIIDDYSEMEIVSSKPKYIEDSYSYFSLLNISGTSKGITIKNAKYPLNDAEITCEYQYGISNEVNEGKVAQVTVKEGKALLIKVY